MSFRPRNPPPPGVNPQYSSFSYPGGGFTPPPQPEAQRKEARLPGIPGGSWGEVSSADSVQLYAGTHRPAPANAPAYRMTDSTPPSQPAKRVVEQPRPHLMVAAEPGAYERALIDDLTQPGGARPRPPDKDLLEFSSKCRFLDAAVVSQLLFERLSDQTRGLVGTKQKVLYLLERLASDYPAYQEIIKTNWGLVQQVQDQSPSYSRVVQSIVQLLSPVSAPPAYEQLVMDTPSPPAPQGRGLFGALTVKGDSLPSNVFSAPSTSDSSKKGPVFQDILSL